MDHRVTARALLGFLCLVQGLATVAIDLNRTHATNPDWPGHARFHLVWQNGTTFLLAGLAAALVWWPGPLVTCRFYLAAALTSIPLLAFLAAFLGRACYRGTLSDRNGIPAARLVLRGKVVSLDMNFVAVVAALPVLAVILAIYSL